MINRILIFVLCVLALCATVSFFGTPEQNAIMFSVLSKIWNVITNVAIVGVLSTIAGFSIIIFASTIIEERNDPKEIQDNESYPMVINLSFLLGSTSLIQLMIVILMIAGRFGVPDLVTSVISFIIIFFFILSLTYKRMYKEVAPLMYLFYQDTWTNKVRVLPKGWHLTALSEAEKDSLDISATLAFDVIEDFQTATKGAMIKTKASAVFTPYLGEDDTSIVDKAKAAIRYFITKKALGNSVIALVKKIQKEFYTPRTIKAGLSATSEEVFEVEKFKEFEKDFPVKFTETTIYDAQADEATLAQDREIRNAQNFRQIITTLMKGKNGMSKEKAEEIAPYLAEFKWAKTVDENTYRVIVEGLPEDLGKLITPQTIAAVGAIMGKGKANYSKKQKTT